MKLLAVVQFIFGCRHRHLSRVFTIKLRTYRVCFDCGREFDLPDASGDSRERSSRRAKGTTEAVNAKYELMERGGYIPTGYKFDPVILNAKLPLE